MIRIGVPPRARLVALHRHTLGWIVWLNVRDLQESVEKWQGDYILLKDDGTIQHTTIHPDMSESTIQVR